MAIGKFIDTPRLGRDTVAPYGVYLNGEQIAIYECENDAVEHFSRVRQSLMTPAELTKDKDRLRHALQAPIASPKFQVVYLKGGKEHRSPWLYRREHAHQALALMQGKYGQQNAIIYVD